MAEQPRTYKNNSRQRLIDAGIAEINEFGITHFSSRRVAAACGLTGAAVAKHFGNRDGFLSAIIEYVNGLWAKVQDQVLKENEGSVRNQIVEESVEYVEFLVQNPSYRSILMLKDGGFDNTYHKRKGETASPTQKLILAFGKEQGLDENALLQKVYVIRSLIFGAALMFDTGELSYSEASMAMVRRCIERELDAAAETES